jgi:hypothetical protein
MSAYSLNGNLILTPYTKAKELQTTEVATGFVMTANKIGIEPLTLLVDTVIELCNNEQRFVPKGSKIYFKQETLYVQKWPRAIMESDQFPEGFVVGHIKDALFIEESDGN